MFENTTCNDYVSAVCIAVMLRLVSGSVASFRWNGDRVKILKIISTLLVNVNPFMGSPTSVLITQSSATMKFCLILYQKRPLTSHVYEYILIRHTVA